MKFDICVNYKDKYVVCEYDGGIVFITGWFYKETALKQFYQARDERKNQCCINTISSKVTFDRIVQYFIERLDK